MRPASTMQTTLYSTASSICLLSLFIATQLAARAASAASSAPPELPLKDSAFTLASTITIISANVGAYKYEVEESYSNLQQRAKIKYKTIGKMSQYQTNRNLPREGTFYVSEYGSVFLVDDDQQGRQQKCRLANEETISKLFQEDLWNFNYDESPYLIGPARILFYLNQYRDRMTLSQDFMIRVRNTPSVMYEYKAKDGLTYSLFYSSSNTDTSLRLRVPLEIVAGRLSEFNIIYDFSQIDSSLDDETHLGSFDWNSDDQPAIDPLAIPLSAGCSQLSKEFNSAAAVMKFDHHLDDKYSFSFEGRAKIPGIKSVTNMFVAYEHSMSSMRVDRISETKITALVSNHKLERAYHIFAQTGTDTRDHVIENIFRISSDPNGDANPETTPTQSCVIVEDKSVTAETSLGDLLLGSTQFMYMGRASVRGIEAFVYESYDTNWPVWLRQSTVYYHGHKDGIVQSHVRPCFDGPYKLSTVIYLAAANKRSVSIDTLRLMQMELVRFTEDADKKYINLVDRITVQVADFTWSLPARALDGLKANEMFSIGDHCQPSDGQHYGRIEMILQAPVRTWTRANKDQLEWLEESQQRDFALMAALQQSLQIPVTQVSDLRSRVLLSPNDNTEPQVALSFRLVEHDKNLAKLISLGRGKLSKDYVGQTYSIIVAFQACYYLAAHRKIETYIAFQPSTGMCIIDLGMGGQRRSADVIAFELSNSDGPYELYVIKHQHDPTAPTYDLVTRLGHGTGRLEYLTSKGMISLRRSTMSQTLELNIKSMKFTESNEKNSYQVDEQILYDTNKFPGFGLVASDVQNRRVSPITTTIATATSTSAPAGGSDGSSSTTKEEQVKTEMTFGQCQAACLADFGCQSFSVCIKQGEVECILSTFSFRRPLIVLKLMELQKKEVKLNSQELLHVDDTSTNIHLRMNPICELHNKIYLRLFKTPPGSFAQPIVGMQFMAVTGREQCARLWFGQTLRLIREEVISTSQVSWDLLRNPASDPNQVREALKSHSKAADKLSERMLYLDAEQLRTMPEEVEEYVKKHLIKKAAEEDVTELVDGYCSFNDRYSYLASQKVATTARPSTSNVQVKQVPLESYTFQYELFFERQTGVRLRQSRLGWEEQVVLNLMHYKNAYDDSIYEQAKSFIERGGNNQRAHYTLDETGCASICLRQNYGIWPACRSFSMQIRKVGTVVTYICYLNTLTLREAIRGQRWDLIEYAGPNAHDIETQTWHYDPKPGFIEDELSQETRLWMVDFGLQVHSFVGTLIGPLGIFLLVVISLVSGTLLGAHLGLRYLDRIAESATESDTSNLVDRPTIEFRNLVNFEGNVADQPPDGQNAGAAK